jgi:hypothetical protein
MTIAVLNQMQVLDQEIATARAVTKQRLHLLESTRIDLAAPGGAARAAGAIGAIGPAIRTGSGIH